MLVTGHAGSYADIGEIEYSDSDDYKFSLAATGMDANSNYFVWDGNNVSIKGDFFVGADDNAIYFQDSSIALGDNQQVYSGDVYSNYIRFADSKYNSTGDDMIICSIGNSTDSTTEPTWYISTFSLQNRFYDYDNPSVFVINVEDDKVGFSIDTYDSSSHVHYGYVSFKPCALSDMYIDTQSTSIKSAIPTWVGGTNANKTVYTSKYPNDSNWSNAEDCPFSNVWVWKKADGEVPQRVLYVRTQAGETWYVAMTKL